VVGIGINVNQVSFPPGLREEAISLRQATGSGWSRVELAAALLKSLDREYRSLQENTQARESVVRRFEEHSSYAQGRAVRVEDNGGFDGVTAGLDARGFLQIRTAEGLRTVLSGVVKAR
jgi:BirA family biotin operon repressor/biotin-[acetyl-CoA-carboxylase] ligase